MPRGKRKRATAEQSDSENEGLMRRSSLKVNLSFTSNLSESDETPSEEQNEDLLKTVRKRSTKNVINHDASTPASVANVTVVNPADCKVGQNRPSKTPKHLISSMNEKEQQLDRSCMELKNAIMNKTQVLSDDELTKKTSEILTGCSSHLSRISGENHENRSPRVKINIGNNDQIVMAGCGEKQNLVVINSMSKSTLSEEPDNNKASQNSNYYGSDCSQSIASTPKKCNIETSVDKSTGETCKQVINIPVARLFTDIDPNNSMSEVNPIPGTETIRSNNNYNSNICRTSNQLNHTVSPILSQGIRKTRTCRLSLKKKPSADETGISRISTSTNESYVNRLPVTCSSFIERPDKTRNQHLDQHTKTIIIGEKSKSGKNQNTINLDDNENNTNTINIDQSSCQSSMEITAVSSRTPVIRRPFQQLIQKSFDFEKADIPGNETKKSSIHNEQFPNNNKSLSKDIHKSNAKIVVNTDIVQEDCSANTVKTSLNVNTSLDDVSLAERIIHKENEKSSHTTQLVDQASQNNIAKESQTLTTMRSSLRVNTSIDSIRKSSDSSKTDSDKTENAQLQPTSSCNIQEKEKATVTIFHRPSNGTVRTSMQVNTSLDSVKKSPDVQQQPLNYNKILSMVMEAPSDNSQTCNLQCQSSENDSEAENTPLSERIRIKYKSNKRQTKASEDSKLENKRNNSDNENSNSQNSDLKISRFDTPIAKRKSTRKSKTDPARKAVVNEQSVTSTTNESSIVEATPFPASRSLLLKTMIKNNIAMNTLDPRRLAESSDDDEPNGTHLAVSKKAASSTKRLNRDNAEKNNLSDSSLDTIIVNSSDESSSGLSKHKERVVIEESLNDTGGQSKSETNKSRKSKRKKVSSTDSDNSSDGEEKSKKRTNKRKLYPLRENSQISFSPAEIVQAPREPSASKDVKKKKNKKLTQKKQETVKASSPEPAENADNEEEDEIPFPEPEKKKKKPRKIKSKKIVVKKVTNLTMLDNIMEIEGELEATKDRSSLQEFDLRIDRGNRNKGNKDHKIVIVVTGLEKEDKDLVKNVIKSLGSAVLQANVTPRTTHVVSSGVRTINLLKSIIRGCWLLTLEWALKSLESGNWLDPSPYEMSHFARAVQVNRRDRQIFGKAYVPELFVTCGLVYIENGTTPPTPTLKELVKTAGGRITEDPNTAKIIVGLQGLKENWILDSITTGELQRFEQYRRQ